MRDGLSLLDQAIAYGAGELLQKEVEQMLGLVEQRHITELIEGLGEGDAKKVLQIVENIYAQSCDPESVLTNLAETLHRISVLHCVPEYRDRDRPDWSTIEVLSKNLSHESAQLYYQIAIKGSADLGLAPDPRTGLEMTLLRMLAFEPARSGNSEGGTAVGGASGAVQSTTKKSHLAAQSSRSHAAKKKKGGAPSALDDGDPGAATSAVSKPSHAGVSTTRVSSEREWISIIAELPISGQVRELARNLHLQSAKDGNLSFVISPSLRHLGSKQCVERLGQAISQQLGQAVQISLTDGSAEDLLTAAGLAEKSQLRKQSDAERAIEEDPAIKALKETFDASIVEDSIQALQ